MEKNYQRKLRKLKYGLRALLFFSFFCFSFAKADEVQKSAIKTERLENYLRTIEDAYKVSFVYDATQINKEMSIDVPVKLISIKSDLEPLKVKGINYNIVGKQVILKKVVVAVIARKDIVVKGTVRAKKDNDFLPGVSVREKGASNGVSTNGNGEYQIKVKDGATLVFTAIGYKTEEAVVGGRTAINIVLEEDISQLKEVTISTGYQNLNKKLFTGAATSIKGSDVKQDGITDVSRMLEGRVAGVSVQNVSGTFGAAPKIRVRGATSITGENKPLWVVDGVILEDVVNISNEQLSTGDATTLIGSSVAGINADDIESFNILKDAAATAQYGARAMNGVVVITTKKGRVGSPVINYTGNFSTFLKPTYDNYNIMNSADQMSIYGELARKGWLNHASTARSADGGVFSKMYQLINTYDGTTGSFGLANTQEAKEAFLTKYARVNTDWFDELFKNSLMQEHSISISTGTEKSQMYFSTSFLDDNGWAKGNGVQRYTANLNANFKFSEKLSANIITTGAIRDQTAPGTVGRVSTPEQGKYSRDFDINPFSYALNTSRTMTAYDENGNRESFTRNYAPFNILTELENNRIELSMLDFKLQGGLKYEITKDLKYDVLGSLRYVKTGREHKVYESSNMANAYRAAGDSNIQENNRFLYRDPLNSAAQPAVVLPYGGFYNTTDDFLKAYLVRNALEYNKTINEDHLINVYAFQEMRIANRQNKSNIGYGYQYDKGGVAFIDPRVIQQAVQNNLPYYTATNEFDRFAAFMARAAYSYKGKYSFNATARYDGSNQLGDSPTARWLPTWNVSGAWNIDTEDFMKKQTAINRLTLRGTYGLTASLGSATNSSLILRNASTLRPYSSEIESVMNLEALENSELTWEKQYETNIGLDAGFFNEKFTLSLDLYNRNGFDLISPIRTSGIGGQPKKSVNYADMKSQGIELALGATIFNAKDYGWRTSFNFGYNKNKVTSLKSEPNIFELVGADGGPKEGYPYRGLYSLDFKGLRNADGMPEFLNEKGQVSRAVDLVSDQTQYLKYEGAIDPKLTGGFYNQFRYKAFTLSALVTFSAGNKVRLNPMFNANYSDLDASPLEFKDRWTLPGDELITNVPSIVDRAAYIEVAQAGAFPYNNYNYSSVRVADGGFIRLKQISLSYNMPKNILSSIGASNASVSLVGNNFWLIYSDKKLNGQDPEFFSSGGVALPIPKQYTLSLKIGF